MVKAKKRKYISYVLRFGVAGAALYLAFRGEDFSKVGKVLLNLSPWIVLIAICGWLANQVIFVLRWTILLRVQSIRISYWAAFRLHLLGVFYNNCLPSAVGGDLLRAWYVTTHTDKKVEAALSVFVDRSIGISGMILMAVGCYWLIPVEGKEQGQVNYEVGAFDKIAQYWWVLPAFVGVIAVMLALLGLIPAGRRLLKKVFAAAYDRGRALLDKIRMSIMVYCRNKLTLLGVMLLTFVCQSVIIVGMMLVGQNIGLEIHPKYYFVFFPVAWMLGALPISVGGLGIWEGALVVMFGGTGVMSSEKVMALALFHRILWLFGSLPGVVIHLLGAHLPKNLESGYTLPETGEAIISESEDTPDDPDGS